MTRETDRTTAEHEAACVVDVLELETERAALESLLGEAGYTEGTITERVALLLMLIDNSVRALDPEPSPRRDPDHPCDGYETDRAVVLTADCETDGHHLCRGCARRDPDVVYEVRR